MYSAVLRFHLLSSILYPLSSILYPLSSIIYPLSSIIYPLSSILYHLSSILYPLSSILYPLSSPHFSMSRSSIHAVSFDGLICLQVLDGRSEPGGEGLFQLSLVLFPLKL